MASWYLPGEGGRRSGRGGGEGQAATGYRGGGTVKKVERRAVESSFE